MTHERIAIDAEVMLGKPVIRGTRITVEHLLRECASGLSAEQIAELYPSITPDDVRAALAYAADHLGRDATIAAE